MGCLKGEEAEILKDDVTLGLCTGITIDVDPSIDGVWELGSRTVSEWKEGNKEITGTIDRSYWNWTLAKEVCDTDVEDSVFVLKVKLYPDTAATQIATLSGVLFTTWGHEIPADGIVTESLDFVAKDISFSP